MGKWLTDTYNAGGTGKQTTWEGGHREPGLAIWPNHIAAGSHSNATLSALDVLPTFAALAGATLPPNRMHDGLDMGPVLFDGERSTFASTGNMDWQFGGAGRPGGALFHPNSGAEGTIGEIKTLRVGDFKAKKLTGGSGVDCAQVTAPAKEWDPPLIFDLANDPAEAHPLTHDDPRYAGVLEKVETAFESIATSVLQDNTTVADYSNDYKNRPCCNQTSRLCLCSGG